MRALEYASPYGPACKCRAIRHSSAWSETRWNSGHPKGSRSLLIGVIILEPIALIVLDAPQRSGVHLVQDHTMDPIQQHRGVRKTLADQALTCFPPLDDEDEAATVPRDHLVVDDSSHRRCLDDHEVIGLARNLD